MIIRHNKLIYGSDFLFIEKYENLLIVMYIIVSDNIEVIHCQV